MKRRVFKILSVLLLAIYCVVGAYAQSTCNAPENVTVNMHKPEWFNLTLNWEVPANDPNSLTLIYDNGNIVTDVGVGLNGADVSKMNARQMIQGKAINKPNNQHVVDDFILTNEAKIDYVEFYAYPSGYTSTNYSLESPFNAAYVRIWDGKPNAGGKVIWGDDMNRFSETGFTNCFRVSASNLVQPSYPIMYIKANMGVTLAPGTYWIELSAGSSKSNLPWTIHADLSLPAGNAMTTSNRTTWANWTENLASSGTKLVNLPFKLYGEKEQVSGYNIFKDGVKQNMEMVTDRSFNTEVSGPGTYVFGVSALYGNPSTCESDASTVTVVMTADPCAAPINLPVLENFDGNFATSCWNISGKLDAVWELVADGTNPTCTPASGTGMLRFNCPAYNKGAKSLLRSPYLNFNNSDCIASFKLYRNFSLPDSLDRINVYVSTTKSISGLTPVYTINRSATKAPAVLKDGWYDYRVALSSSTLTAGYVFFEVVSNGGNNLYIDDIQIGGPLSICSAPKNLEFVVNNPNWKNVQLIWDGYIEALGYNIYRNGVKVNTALVTATQYVDLAPAAGNTVYAVTAVWSDNCESSPLIKTVTITPEECSPRIAVFPFEENFNTNTFPVCWTNDYMTGNAPWSVVNATSGQPTTAKTGAYKMYFHSYLKGETTKLVLPAINLSLIERPVLTFWHAQKAYNANQDELRIYYKNSPTAKWTLLATYTDNVPEWTERVITLPDASESYWIAFEGVNNSGYGVMLDEISVYTSDKCEPVQHLNYAINNRSIHLSWDTPTSTENLLHYNVYRNNVLLASNVTVTEYTDASLALGPYTYDVEAVYNNFCGTSKKMTTPELLVVDRCGEQLKNLTIIPPADPDWYTVGLKWDTPTEEHALAYSGATMSGSIGQSAQAIDFSIASRWEPADLTTLDGQKITVVKFIPADKNCNYSIRIWQGGSATDPGTLLVDQTIATETLTIGQWNIIRIAQPPVINASQQLWIGIRCNMTAPGRPAAYDNIVVEELKGKSDMIYDGQSWTPLSAQISRGSWCLGALAGVQDVTRKGFNVYRNDVKINVNPIFDNFLKDELSQPGTYKYGVSAVYDDYCESVPVEKEITVSESPCMTPRAVPFVEGFDDVQSDERKIFVKQCYKNETTEQLLWENVTKTMGFPQNCFPQSGAGMLGFNSFQAKSGTRAALTLPVLDLSGNNYVLKFYMYRDEGSSTKADRVNVYLTDKYGVYTDLTPVLTINRNRHLDPVAPAIGWYEYSVTLDCSQMTMGRLVFEAIGLVGTDIYIDNIRVEPVSYMISSSAGTGGTISPAGDTPVYEGSDQTFQITADPTYAISEVLVDGVNIPSAVTNGRYTFVGVDAAHTITASFVSAQYTISAAAGQGGTISPSGAVGALVGDNKSFTVIANTGFNIANVLVDGAPEASAIGSNTYTYEFANINENHTIAAAFAPLTYTITALTDMNGTISPSGTLTVEHGSEQSYTFTPNTGYKLDQVLIDGVNNPAAVAAGSYSFTDITTNHTIDARFTILTYTLDAIAGSGGTIAPSGTMTVNYGSNQSFTVTPNTGYEIQSILIDDVNNSAAVIAGSYTFTNITTDHTIAANFVQLTYTITATAGTGGTINPSGTLTLTHGSSRTYTITPNAGYKIVQVLIDGLNNTDVVNNGNYVFTNITTNHTIEATFERMSYTLTATAGTGGTILPNGTVTVNYGGTKNFVIMPDNYYRISEVLIDGTNNPTAVENGYYTFTNIAADHTIAATFVKQTPKVNNITVNNEPLPIDSHMQYMAACGDNTITLSIDGDGDIRINGDPYTSGTPKLLAFDNHKADIVITATIPSVGSVTYRLVVSEALGSAAKPLYVERWGKTLAVINNPLNNGGYTFDAFKWYRDGSMAVQGTGNYIEFNNNRNAYYADVHMLQTGEWHHTCRTYVTQRSTEITIYPNPVATGKVLNLSLPEGVEKVNISIYDLAGKLIRHYSRVSGSIATPETMGVYLLHIQLPGGIIETQKIVVY